MRNWSNIVELIDKLTVSRLIIASICTVILFSLLFYFLTLRGNGIVFNFAGEDTPGYFDCLYFSVVTISSLGYGDIRPTGIARFACSAEVVIGLALFGLLVSRLATRKQDLHLSVVYNNIVRESLDKFLTSFKSLANEYAEVNESIIQYQAEAPQSRQEDELRELMRGLYFRLRGSTNGLRQYIDYCTKSEIVYDYNHYRLLRIICKNLNKILPILNTLPEKGRKILLKSVSERKLDQLLVSMLGMLTVLTEQVKDDAVLKECLKAERFINDIRLLYKITKDKTEYISINTDG